jgi:hypothetical protein
MSFLFITLENTSNIDSVLSLVNANLTRRSSKSDERHQDG